MITYEYETLPQNTDEAPERFTLRQSIKDAAITQHPLSGQPVRRVFQSNPLLRAMRRVVAPLHGTGSDCCGPEGGACHH